MADHENRRGGAFYDRSLLDAYLAHRHRPVSSPNLVMEEPAFLAEAGDLNGLRVLDLGCGDGSFGSICSAAGCESYLGVDGSPQMIELARRAVGDPAVGGPAVGFQLADLEDFEPAPTSFDLVASRLALHYVADIGSVLARANRALAPRGRLLISVVHPVISAAESTTEPVTEEHRTSQIVDSYFLPGRRDRRWFDRPVVWHHRSTEQYVAAVLAAGFTLTALRECEPVEQLFAGDRAEYRRRLRVPLFLLLHAVKRD